MKTNADLEQIADALFSDYTSLRSEKMPRAIKLLRSIELDAWREAREMVDKMKPSHPGTPAIVRRSDALAKMDRIIQQLQLK